MASGLPDLPNVPPIGDPSLWQFLQGLRARMYLLSSNLLLFDESAADAVRRAILEGERQIAELQAKLELADAEINALVDDALNDITAIHAQLVDIVQAVTDVEASVSAEAVARANADGAIAALVSTLNATVGGHSSTLSTQSSAIATIAGQFYSRWMINADANGVVSSVTLVSASGPTTVSAFVVQADSFLIKPSSASAVQPFYYNAVTGTLYTDTITVRNANIENLTISGGKIGNGQITTGKVATNAVTDGNSSSAMTTYGFSPGSSGPILYCTITTNSAEAKVQITFTGYLSPDRSPVPTTGATQQDWVYLRIKRGVGGSTIYTVPGGTAILDQNGYYTMGGGMVTISWEDEPGAGTFAYEINMEATSDKPNAALMTNYNVNIVRFDR